MAIQKSVALRNAELSQIEVIVGTAPKLIFYSGAMPASVAAAASGTVIATLSLPSDWMANPSGGSQVKSGTWEDTAADNAGTIGHFRIWDTAVAVCHYQGTVTITGGGGDMTVDNTNVAAGQDVLVNGFTRTAANA